MNKNRKLGRSIKNYKGYAIVISISSFALLAISIMVSGGFPRIGNFLSDIATGLIASAIVIYFVEQRVSQLEANESAAMLEIFSRKAKDSVSDLLSIYCGMIWAGSFDKPKENSMIHALSRTDLEEIFNNLDAKEGGPDCSESKWATPLIGHIHSSLKTSIDTLARCTDRYIMYIPDDLLLSIEAVISSKIVGLTSDISNTLSRSIEDRAPFLGLIDILVAREFPLAKPCAENAADVFRLAKCFSSYFPGILDDTPWWVKQNSRNSEIRVHNHGYAILKSKREAFEGF